MLYRLKSSKSRSNSGFTLVELMITIAIMGVLAAIVVPSYTTIINRGKLYDSTNQLAQLRLSMERFFQNNNSYGGPGVDDCGVTMPNNANDDFNYVCVSTSNNVFTITATNKANRGLGDASDYDYRVNQNGDMLTFSYAGTDYDPAKSCWWIKKDEC